MEKLLFSFLLSLTICYSANAQWSPTGYNETMVVEDLHFLNGSVGFAAGYHQVYKTVDAGNTWTEISNNLFINGPTCVWFFNETTGIIAGKSGGGELQVGKTFNGGTTWTVTTLSGMGFNSPNQILFLDDNVGYIACREGKIFKTINQGSSWTQLPTGTTNDITSIHFPSATVGYATFMYSDKLIKTINGGNSWSQISLDQLREVNHVYFTDINTGYLACGNSTILKTSDGGNSWMPFSFGTSDIFYDIKFTSSQYGYAVGGGGTIAQTSNAGNTWYTVPSGLGTLNNLLYSIDFPSADTGYVATLGGGPGIILKTFNGGGFTSVEEISDNNDFVIYPNPVNDVLYLSTNNFLNYKTYYIIDQLGRVLLSGELTEKTTKVDINGLTGGVYFLQFGEQKKQLMKIIKH